MDTDDFEAAGQSGAFGSHYWRSGEGFEELFRCFFCCGYGELVAGDFLVELAVVVLFLACHVMRTNLLANVASIYAFGFGDFFGEMVGDLVFVFDCEVGDAEAGVDDAGGDDGAGGAGIEAFGAVAADFGWAFWVGLPAVAFWRG